MNLLLPDSGLIFWMTIIFAIVFFVLAKFGFPVITGMVEKRHKRIEDALEAARVAEEAIAHLNQEQERIMEENNNLVQLQDENGNDVNFEHLMTVEYEGSYYVLLEATEDMDDCQQGEAIILKIIRDDESGDDVYATIEDEDELNAVFEKCMAIMEEEDEANEAMLLDGLEVVEDDEEE